ncbi:S-layer homology domain-containing protein [Paenibacillus sp. Soil766]|uniref:S-layer homology domain-containing protein n=1 Tax=Paenibacillus sp. Soil766 TaxID=1736404 RepID=UPI000B11BBE5|nr:S-layer homology domain-containing protein [Paenibacillus sp. Soil766]
MKHQKRMMAMLLSCVILFSMIPFGGTAAAAVGDWAFSAFGSSTSEANNSAPTENADGSVTIVAKNGKLASNEEGISFYYKQLNLPADANFEINAIAKVKSFNSTSSTSSPNQKSFGLMLRSDFLVNNTKQSSNYVAVGGFGPPTTGAYGMQAFYKTGITGTTFDTNNKYIALPPFSNVNVPSANEVYDMKIKKSGDAFELTVNGKTEKLLLNHLFGNKIYAGLYVTRDAEITFSNFGVKVDQRMPNSLVVDATTMKKVYLKDSSLDTTGLKVRAIYADNTEEVLSANDYIITGFDSGNLGTIPITISFNGVTHRINDINIVPLTATSLGIKYVPAKTEYYIGDLFDPEGLVVTAAYNSGTVKDLVGEDISKYGISISGATVTGSTYLFDTPGTQTVTVRSTETPTTFTNFNVTVKAAQMTDLVIHQLPHKTTYFIGQPFEQAGLAVYAKYSDNSEEKLLRNEFTLTSPDMSMAGTKTITISSYKSAATKTFPVIVKQQSVVGIEVSDYPRTTYEKGQDLDLTGLGVSWVYDSGNKEKLNADQYDVVYSEYDKTTAGVYNLQISLKDTAFSTVLPITVTEPRTFEWKSIRFGQSTSTANNKVNVTTPGSVAQLIALEGGGKVTGDHDGISFYYVELDPTKDNFELSADIKVSAYAKDPHDGQESFGIMARDAIGTAGDSTVFASNIAAIGGYSGATTKQNGTQLFVRTGVASPDGAGSLGVQSKMLEPVKPTSTTTASNYKLTLIKTNSGFSGILNTGTKESFFVPDIMKAQDQDTMYVGFYVARLATIDVSNIDLKVSAAATDKPMVEPAPLPVIPDVSLTGLTKTSDTNFSLGLKSNVNGMVTIKQGDRVLLQNVSVTKGVPIIRDTTVTANTYTNFSAAFVPDDTQYLTSYDKIVKNFTVDMKTYRGGEDIYVSPTAQRNDGGVGSQDQPLDLDTAIAYVRPGQKVILLDGTYVRDAKIDIPKGHDGTASAMKSLVAAPDAKPIIDFNKKSEGVVLSGSYWHVKGIDFTRTANNTKGFTVGGSNNIVEGSRFYANGDTGLQISRTDESVDKEKWPSNNRILNCESFDNADPSNNNADGFAAKLTSGTGNIFRGDISHNNIDDGWDLYTKAGTGAIGPVIIEDSIAYNNGTLTNGSVGAGDKNGFKLGGEGIHVPHIIRNSIAFGNGAYGFASNSNPGVRAESTNIAFNNAKGNLNFTSYTGIALDFRIDGFTSYHTSNTAKDNYPAALNSATNYMWNGTKSVNQSGVQLTDANFASLEASLPFQRDAEGNIIRGSFLQFIAPQASINNSSGGSAAPSADLTSNEDGVQVSINPVNQTINGKNVAVVTVDGGTLSKAFDALKSKESKNQKITIDVNSTEGAAKVQMDANALSAGLMNAPDALLSIKSNEFTYDLPAKSLDLAEIAETLGTDVSHVKINISIEKVTGPTAELINDKAKQAGLTLLSGAVDFTITAEGNGKNVTVNNFGNTYVPRTITLVQTVDSDQLTAVLFNPETGEMSFVPAVVTMVNGKTEVTIKRQGNSIYTIVQSSKTFDDVQGHWAKNEIELLASKLVIKGTSDTTFGPNNGITRAEFAALLVRSLGLKEEASTLFTDVPASSWFAGTAGASAKSGLIEGFEDGSFRPNERITREQMAVMITRAMTFAGKSAPVDLKQLDKFTDSKGLSTWSKDAVAAAVSAGIVNGVTEMEFVPVSPATRAEAAVMLKGFLQWVQFIN